MHLLVWRPFHTSFGSGELLNEIEELVGRNASALLRECRDGLGAKFVLHALRIALDDEQVSQVLNQIRHQAAEILARFRLSVNRSECLRRLRADQVFAKLGDGLLRGEAEN